MNRSKNRNSWFIGVLSIAMMSGSVAFVAAADPPKRPEGEVVRGPVGERVDRYLSWAEAFGFSGSALVGMDGEVVLHKGYGLANREKGIRNEPNSYFSFGSIAKQFTGAAVAELHAQGKLDVQDPITKYVNDVPEDKRGITIYHLLTHTAGIPDYHAKTDFEPMDRETAVRNILAKELDFEPGSRFSYSNSGYTLAAAIAEVVSGRPYVELMQEEFFKPAGMTNTGFMGMEAIWGGDEAAYIYRGTKNNGSPMTLHGPTWALLGNGGVISSVGEMWLWDRALHRNDVISSEAKELIFTPFLNDYAFGWDVLKSPWGTTLHSHNGGSTMMGLSADFYRFPDDDAVVIIASNATILGKLAIAWVSPAIAWKPFEDGPILPDPPEPREIARTELREVAGSYVTPDGGEVRLWEGVGKLGMSVSDQENVDALMGPGPAERARVQTLNAKARRVIIALRDGNEAELAELIGDSDSAEWFRGAAPRVWERWENESGKLETYRILGTTPTWWGRDARGDATWIRFKFERRTRVQRWEWTDGNFASIGGSAYATPFICAVIPTPGREFAFFHFGLSSAGSIEFHRDADGRVTGLTARGKGGSFTAKKS